MKAKEIIAKITSGDRHKIWNSSCEIISMGQNRESIIPLIKFLPEIMDKTKNLNMGGALAPNKRFIDFAIRIIEFHRDSEECPCCLYIEYSYNPQIEVENGLISIQKTTRMEDKWVDFYLAQCTRCQRQFKVVEQESHYTWWAWAYA